MKLGSSLDNDGLAETLTSDIEYFFYKQCDHIFANRSTYPSNLSHLFLVLIPTCFNVETRVKEVAMVGKMGTNIMLQACLLYTRYTETDFYKVMITH